MTRDLDLPPLVILNPRFLRMKDLVLNQILPPVGRQNDIKSLSSRAKTRDLDLPPPVILSENEGSGFAPACLPERKRGIWTCPSLSS